LSFSVFAAVWLRNPFFWDVKVRQQQNGILEVMWTDVLTS